jgi:hypothetical protein
MVTLEDVRILDDNVVAGPEWAFRQDKFHYGELELIEEVWCDIQDELVRRLNKRIAEARTDLHEGLIKRENGRLFGRSAYRFLLPLRLRWCRVCGQAFVGIRSSTCTNKCDAERLAHLRAKTGKRRRVRQTLTVCQQCRNQFMPTRHDAKFCSGRCRVAHHRASKLLP